LNLSVDEKSKILSLLDENKTDRVIERLKTLSESQIRELLLEAIMLEHVVKAKIKLLKQDLAISDHV